MAARDATPDILEQLAEAERILEALASRAGAEGFLLVVEHTHDLVGETPDWSPRLRWRPYLERRIYAPSPAPTSLHVVKD